MLIDHSESVPTAWQSDWPTVLKNVEEIADEISRSNEVDWVVADGQNSDKIAGFDDIKFDGKFSPFPAKFPLPDQNQYDAVLLFSDGQFNVGQSPLDADWINHVPIFPILPVDPRLPSGLKIDALIVPDFVQAGDSLTVQLIWHSVGQVSPTPTLIITDMDSDLEFYKKVLKVGQTVKTKLKISKPGLHHLAFAIESSDNQLLAKGKKMVRVGKFNQNVVIIADALTPLVGVIQRSLLDTNYTVESLILTKQNKFLLNVDPEKIASADLLILLDDGALAENPVTLHVIQRIYRDSIPTIIFNRANSRLDQLISGVQAEKALDQSNFLPILTSEGKDHPMGIMALPPADARNGIDYWTGLPPLATSENNLVTRGIPLWQKIGAPKSQVTGSLAEDKPLLVLNGNGYWRWFFRPAGEDQFDRYWKDVLAYLINRTDLKLVSIEAQNRDINVGDNAPVIVRVRDVEGAPQDFGVTTLVQTQLANQKSVPLELRRTGSGIYQTSLNTFENGVYHLEARTELNGKIWGIDTLTVNIAPFSAESQITGVNSLMLDRLAAKSGGKLIHKNEISEIRLPAEKYIVWHQFFWPGLRDQWLMILVVVVLGLEWTFRRRIGLM